MSKKKSVEKKATDEIQEFKNKLAKSKLKVGDLFIDSYGEILRIGRIDFKEMYIHTEIQHGDRWSSYGSNKIDEFEDKSHIKLEKPIEEYETEAIKKLSDLESLRFSQGEISSTQALMKIDNQALIVTKNILEQMETKVEIIHRIVKRKLDQLNSIKHELSTQLAKVYKVIGIIEIYLGIKETIIQIQEGQSTPAETSVAFRQEILFMDEEVGDPTDGGLDFERIEQFDSWVTDNKNYNKLVPEEKCVVVLKPRRYEKEYAELSVFEQGFYNAYNKMTYILIRNGENLYRIFSENISIDPNFFPSKEQMGDLFDTAEGRKKDTWGHDIEEAQEQIVDYKKHLLLMRGLAERTDILHPLPEGFSFSNQESYEKHIQFIYDEGPSLTEGKETYENWKKRINEYIKRGSRILFTGYPWSLFTERYDELRRFPHYVSERPPKDIYLVDGVVCEKSIYRDGETERLICHYNPKDSVWGYYEYHERKRSIAFYLYKDDDFVLNYDLIDLESIERFLHDRYDRRNYLHMIPILYGIKRNRLKELEKEKALVKLIGSRNNVGELEVWRAIDWWKTKNIWKRPIMKDDAKALRMIERRLRK